MTPSTPTLITKPTTSWLTAAFTLVVIGWGANQFSPLLVAYESVTRIGTTQADGLFALYAVGLVPGLFIGGPLSDRLGRRTIALVGLIVSLTASTVLAVGGLALPLLYPGRLLAGFASGIGFSCGTAWLQELSTGAAATRGPRRAATAMTIGFAGGPLVAGVVAQVSPAPLVAAYLPHLVLAAVAIIVVVRSRAGQPVPSPAATAPGSSGRPNGGLARLLVLLAPWVFIAASVGLAILPASVDGSVGSYAVLFAAVVVSFGALCGVLVQPVIGRLRQHRRPARALAYGLGVVGLLIGAQAIAHTSATLVVIAGAFLGSGYGALLVVGLGVVREIAPAHRLGRTVATFQAATYVGYTSPFFISLAARYAPLPAILIILTAAAVACLALLETLERARNPL